MDGTGGPAETVDLWRAGVDRVPEWVWRPPGPRALILADNALTSLPARIGELQRLHTLDAAHNALTRLPPQLGELTGLSRCLYLHGNRLTELPPELGRLGRLSYLNAGENPLSELPRTLGDMGGLVELRAGVVGDGVADGDAAGAEPFADDRRRRRPDRPGGCPLLRPGARPVPARALTRGAGDRQLPHAG